MLALALALACRPPDDVPPDPPASAVEARLHDAIGSLVYVSWEQAANGTAWVRYSADGQSWMETPRRELGPGPQEALLLGLPFGAEASYRVVVDEGDGPVESGPGAITTGAQPEGVPTLDVLAADPSRWEPELGWVLASIDELSDLGVEVRTWSFVFDRQGRVVWAWPTPEQRATIHARVARTGTEFLIDYNSFYATFDGGARSQVARLKIDGTEVARYDTPGLHHPFTDAPDGSLLWGATHGGWDRLARRWPDGTIEETWRCAPFYEALKYEDPDGYCASNTVTWDDATGRVLFSLYSSDSVVEIDPETGEPLRWFGHLPDAWTFAPADSAFWWQHGVHYTDDGTLLVSARRGESAQETVTREYALDEEKGELVQVWSFGEGQVVYGPEMGEAHRLPGGNTLHNYGSGARIREVTPEGDVVWDLTFSSGTWLGRTTPIADLYAFAP